MLAVIGGLQLALFGVHLALDVVGDKDSSVVYRWQGNGLNRGEYPRSEYPLGAVLLFGSRPGSAAEPRATRMRS